MPALRLWVPFVFFIPSACSSGVSVRPAMVQTEAEQPSDSDEALLERLEIARAASEAHPGSADHAIAFSLELESAWTLGLMDRGKLERESSVREAVEHLDAAIAATPAEKGKLWTAKGSLLMTTGDLEAARLALTEAFQPPNLWPVALLLALYGQAGDLEAVHGVCRTARNLITDDAARFELLDQCMQRSQARDVKSGLSWAKKSDQAFYTKRKEELEAANAAAIMTEPPSVAVAPPPPVLSSPSVAEARTPAPPSPVHVTIRSSCPRTVRVFFGDTPKFGSGTLSSVSSNSLTSHTFRIGDKLWTVDERENGMGSAQISSQTREVEIGADCVSLSMR